MKKGARRIGKGWKYRVTALAAVIFIVGSSLTTVYAAERRTLESTVEKKPRIMELERYETSAYGACGRTVELGER